MKSALHLHPSKNTTGVLEGLLVPGYPTEKSMAPSAPSFRPSLSTHHHRSIDGISSTMCHLFWLVLPEWEAVDAVLALSLVVPLPLHQCPTLVDEHHRHQKYNPWRMTMMMTLSENVTRRLHHYLRFSDSPVPSTPAAGPDAIPCLSSTITSHHFAHYHPKNMKSSSRDHQQSVYDAWSF